MVWVGVRNALIIEAIATALIWAAACNIDTRMPNEKVYKLSRTSNGELYVHCANGADATIRVPSEFGSLVVSCGKEKEFDTWNPANQ